MTSRASGSSSDSGPVGMLVEHPQLTQLSAMLKAIDAGDRIIRARLELFNCSRRGLSRRQQQDLQRSAPHTLTDSPLGPLASDSSQLLLANLTSLMSLLFVDYDCTALKPDDFEHCPDKHAVANTINHSLASIVDRIHSGFLDEFWQAVQEAIDLSSCEIYALRPSSGTFEPTDNSLLSFHYFFIDVIRGRILFIGSVTKSRASARGTDSESEVTLSADNQSNSSKEVGSSMGSSLHEGEYCFSSEGDSDAQMGD